MGQIRCFIAIELPEELKRELTHIQTKLKSDAPSGIKWVSPGAIHLTLKFLGSVDADKIDEITGAIESAVVGITHSGWRLKGLASSRTYTGSGWSGWDWRGRLLSCLTLPDA